MFHNELIIQLKTGKALLTDDSSSPSKVGFMICINTADVKVVRSSPLAVTKIKFGTKLMLPFKRLIIGIVTPWKVYCPVYTNSK